MVEKRGARDMLAFIRVSMHVEDSGHRLALPLLLLLLSFGWFFFLVGIFCSVRLLAVARTQNKIYIT